MKCPYCENEESRVIDSRHTEDGHAIRRRRECESCGRRFTTYEKVEEMILMVIKKDGRREAFDRSKLLNGIIRACEKRPVSIADMERIVDEIERGLNNMMEKEVDSTFIGELVMERLKDLDEVAYVRFASVQTVHRYKYFCGRNRKTADKQEKREIKEDSMKDIFKVAIDGPSGAGKSTIAKAVAKNLGIDYVDTGAMYRAVGYKASSRGVSPEDREAVKHLMEDTDIDFADGDIILDGEIINDKIRTPEISKAASLYSAIPEVREKLVEIQRKMGMRKSVIMDGRDIGTNVFRDAEYKIFLTASAKERAERRFEELTAKGQKVDFDEVLRDIEKRDHDDMTRALNPLRKAEDAVEIDTTGLSIDEVIERVLKEIK